MNFSPTRKQQIWDKTKGKCWYCGTQTTPFVSFTIDHVFPLKNRKKNHNELTNLVPCCFSCNQLKGSRTIEDLRRILASLRCIRKVDYMFYFEKKSLVL